jgi:hypothetical protein
MDELVIAGLRLALPSGFRVASALCLGPQATSLQRQERRPTFNVVCPEPAVDPARLAAHVDQQLEELKQLDRYSLVKREELPARTGKAILLRHRFQDEGLLFEQYQLYVATMATTVVLTATDFAGADFAQWEPVFRRLLLSAVS